MVHHDERQAYLAGLPRKVVAAGALIQNDLDQVLIVEPTYKATWELPGGVLECGESARAAADRECQEELALTISLGRLLVIDSHVTSDEMSTS